MQDPVELREHSPVNLINFFEKLETEFLISRSVPRFVLRSFLLSSSAKMSRSSNSSISSISSEEAFQILGVRPEDLLQDRKETVEEVLDIEEAPSSVKDAVFISLCRSIRTHRQPTDGMLEITRSAMFHPILEIVVDQLMKDLKLKSFRDVEIFGEMKLTDSADKPLRGRIDYVVKNTVEPAEMKGEEEEEDGVLSTVTAGHKVLLYVECKRRKAEDGFKQSLIYLKNERRDHPEREVGILNEKMLHTFPIECVPRITADICLNSDRFDSHSKNLYSNSPSS